MDNYYGKFLYTVTDMYKKNGVFCKGMLKVVQKEQETLNGQKMLSTILWDMFTGNERYKNIFYKALSLKMHIDLWKEFAKILLWRET